MISSFKTDAAVEASSPPPPSSSVHFSWHSWGIMSAGFIGGRASERPTIDVNSGWVEEEVEITDCRIYCTTHNNQ